MMITTRTAIPTEMKVLMNHIYELHKLYNGIKDSGAKFIGSVETDDFSNEVVVTSH